MWAPSPQWGGAQVLGGRLAARPTVGGQAEPRVSQQPGSQPPSGSSTELTASDGRSPVLLTSRTPLCSQSEGGRVEPPTRPGKRSGSAARRFKAAYVSERANQQNVKIGK